MNKNFIKLKDQDSNITRIGIVNGDLFPNIDYYYSINGKKRSFLSKDRFFLRLRILDKYFKTPEECLKELLSMYGKSYGENLTIIEGKIYTKPSLYITTKDNDCKIVLDSGSDIISFLEDLNNTVDLSGMYSKNNGKLESIREFIIRELETTNINNIIL